MASVSAATAKRRDRMVWIIGIALPPRADSYNLPDGHTHFFLESDVTSGCRLLKNGGQVSAKATKKSWKIGELANETGLTVRALHHYDQIGLLKPSQETEGGHRVYSTVDVEKLQKIMTLKQLGF